MPPRLGPDAAASGINPIVGNLNTGFTSGSAYLPITNTWLSLWESWRRR